MELDSKPFEFERATINVSCRVLQHRINQPAEEHITLNTCENTVTGELAAVLYSQIHEHLTVARVQPSSLRETKGAPAGCTGGPAFSSHCRDPKSS